MTMSAAPHSRGVHILGSETNGAGSRVRLRPRAPHRRHRTAGRKQPFGVPDAAAGPPARSRGRDPSA